MLPMISVSGTRATMRRSMWDRASSPTQWWQNPTVSFGEGYPSYVPSNSTAVDRPPIQANAGRRSVAPKARGGCYKTSGGCKAGYRAVGHLEGGTICCPTMTGPLRRNNPPQPPSAFQTCVAKYCWDAKNVSGCITKFFGVLKDADVPGTGGRTPGKHRRVASSRRRTQARALARSARSMVTVGHAGKSCCESCAQGGPCAGGCGANCTCGKEGPSANVTVGGRNVVYSQTPTMRMMPARNPSTV